MLRPMGTPGSELGPLGEGTKVRALLLRHSKYSPPPGPQLGNTAQWMSSGQTAQMGNSLCSVGPREAAGWEADRGRLHGCLSFLDCRGVGKEVGAGLSGGGVSGPQGVVAVRPMPE